MYLAAVGARLGKAPVVPAFRKTVQQRDLPDWLPAHRKVATLRIVTFSWIDAGDWIFFKNHTVLCCLLCCDIADDANSRNTENKTR